MSLHQRRHFLLQGSFGISGLALAWLMERDAAHAAPPKPNFDATSFDLRPKPTVGTPRAKAMISMFMQGGPSHIDLFDPKPELTKRHMQTFSGEVKFDNAAEASTKLFGSPWKFWKSGQCGWRSANCCRVCHEWPTTSA